MIPPLRIRFSEDPVCTRGHFPGYPIVPGAFLLDEVIRALTASLRLDAGVILVDAAKFPGPVTPGQCVDLHCEDPVTSAGSVGVKFRGLVDGRTVISGAMRFVQ